MSTKPPGFSVDIQAFIISRALTQRWSATDSLALFSMVLSVFPLKILLWPLNRPNPTKLTDPICSQVNTATHLQQTEKCKSLCKTKNLLCARQRLCRESNNNMFPALLYFLHNHLSLGLGTLLISYYDCDAQLARWARRIFWFITCNAVWFLKKLNHLLMAFLSLTLVTRKWKSTMVHVLYW